MIIIRTAQLVAFAAWQADALVDELLAEAGHTSADGPPRTAVLAGIEAAIALGFSTPDGIRGFVRRLFVLGTAYYENVAVRDWIGDPGLTEEERLAVVDAHADEILATNIAAMRRP